MNIISRIVDEINKCKIKYNRRPNLMLIGQREQNELYIQNQMKLPLPYRYMGIRMLYTHEESELRALIY